MKLTARNRFDADVERVFAALSDPDRLAAMNTAIGATDCAVVSQDDRGGAPWLVTSRRVTVDLPGFARKVMQPTNTVVQTDDWSASEPDGSRTCRYRVEVKGVPSRIDGTMTLRPDGDGCVQQIDAEVKVSIPLLGGRLEKFAVESGRKEIAAQADWLTGHLP